MTEKEDALHELGEAGVLDALRWARRSAYARVLGDYDPDTGHDQGWVGYTGYKLMCDRLDRVFACKKYAVASDDQESVGLDVLALGLDPGEMETRPRIKPGVVVRADVSGSPGWRFGPWTWLTASFSFGEGEFISWPAKSKTKRRVASQADPDQLVLPFEELGLSEAVELIRDVVRTNETVLILAHSVDRYTGQGELILGRSALNPGGGNPWSWKSDLLGNAGGPGSARPIEPQMPTGPSGNDVADVPVRLRRGSDEASSSTNG